MLLLDPAEPIDIAFNKYCKSVAQSKAMTDKLMNSQDTYKQHLKLIDQTFQSEHQEPKMFTVHDLNEAIYSAIIAYIPSVNFA